jgi:hypothetical protein
MKQYKHYKPRAKAYDVEVEVSYVPFPSEKARDDAYDTHVKLFLKAQERMLKGNSKAVNKEGGLENALTSSSEEKEPEMHDEEWCPHCDREAHDESECPVLS